MASGSVTGRESNVRSLLNKNKDIFIHNFEVNKALPKLLSEDIISAAQHQEITSERDRTVQRKRVFDILVQKPGNDWWEPFRRILDETKQLSLIEGFKVLVDGIADIPFGQTVPEHFARVQFPDQHMENRVLDEFNSEAIVDEAIALGVLEIRPGSSICILIRDIENTDESIKKKFTTLIEKAKLAEDVSVKVEVYKMAPDSFFCENFPKTTMLYPETPCCRCLRHTVIENEEFILGQIESDVIEEILARSENVSDYIKNVCSSKNQPRVVRAKIFLMYVLQNQNVLHTFFEVDKKMRLFDLNILECNECQNADKKSLPYDTTKKEPLFCFTLPNGNVTMKRKDEEERANPEIDHVVLSQTDKMTNSKGNTQWLNTTIPSDDFSRSVKDTGSDTFMNTETYDGGLLSIT